jgi:hypothetical protein
VERDRENGLIAGAVAAAVSGVPSTAWALLHGDDPLEATLAAGWLLMPRESRRGRLLGAAVPVHLALSLGWAMVLAPLLPHRREVATGAAGGLAIAAVDLAIVGRLSPRVRALPLLPQLADHLAYGATVGYVLARLRR